MSIRDAVILAVLAVVSVTADAVTNPATTLSAPGLAVVDGMLTNCRKIDPKSFDEFTLAMNSFTQGHKLSELISIRADAAYRTDLASIDSDLRKQSISSQITACRNFLAGK